jgi:hypothetical protein
MFGIFKNKSKLIAEVASHMATLMNLKMIGLKPSISGDFDEETKRDPYILGWLYGLSASGAFLNKFSSTDNGLLLMKICELLFGSDLYAEYASSLALKEDPLFLDAMNASIREYKPIHEGMTNGGQVPPRQYFPSLQTYLSAEK